MTTNSPMRAWRPTELRCDCLPKLANSPIRFRGVDASWPNQLVRAGTSTPLLVAEGANRVSRPGKAHKYTEARSEAAECGAGADVARTQKVGRQELAVEVLLLARRAGSLLTGLIAKNTDEEWARRYRGEL